MFDRLQRISLSYHAPERRGALSEHFSGDLDLIEHAMTNTVPQAILPLTEALLCAGLMFWLDWRAALAGLIFWPWIILAPAAAAAQASSSRESARRAWAVC